MIFLPESEPGPLTAVELSKMKAGGIDRDTLTAFIKEKVNYYRWWDILGLYGEPPDDETIKVLL